MSGLQDFSYNLGKTLNTSYSETAMAQAKISGYHLPTPDRLTRANMAPPPDTVRQMAEDDLLQYEEEQEEKQKEEEEEAGEPLCLADQIKNAVAGTIYDFRNFDSIPGNTTEKVGYILQKDSRWMYFLGLFVVAVIMFILGANVVKWLLPGSVPLSPARVNETAYIIARSPRLPPLPPRALSSGGQQQYARAPQQLPLIGSVTRSPMFSENLKIM